MNPHTIKIKEDKARELVILPAEDLAEWLSDKSLKIQVATVNSLDGMLVHAGSYLMAEFVADVHATLKSNLLKYGEKAHSASERQIALIAADIARRYQFYLEKKAAGLL